MTNVLDFSDKNFNTVMIKMFHKQLLTYLKQIKNRKYEQRNIKPQQENVRDKEGLYGNFSTEK